MYFGQGNVVGGESTRNLLWKLLYYLQRDFSVIYLIIYLTKEFHSVLFRGIGDTRGFDIMPP